MSSSGGNMPRLGPAWRSSASGASRGFQPPPAVPDERASSRDRSGSHASSGSGGGSGEKADKNRNPFAMLGDEDDGAGVGGGGGDRHSPGGGGTNGGGGGGGRFSALRSENHSSASLGASGGPMTSRPFHRASSTGNKPKTGGRSLADLAAGLSGGGSGDPRDGRHHGGHHHHHDPRIRGDHHLHRGDHHERGDPRMMSRNASAGLARTRSGSSDAKELLGGQGSGGDGSPAGLKAIRYTREKLLSLRGRGDEGPPECIKALEGSVVVSEVAQDPVCWDTFDAEEIWTSAARDRRPTDPRESRPKGGGHSSAGRMRDFDSGDEGEHRRGSIGVRGGTPAERFGSSGGFGDRSSVGDRGSSGGFSSGRWQRGVALPDEDNRPSSRGRAPSGSDRVSGRGRGDELEASDPDDLWDDPTAGLTGGATGAAADFSAFGGSLDFEPPQPKGKTGMNAFDLSDMSKAAAEFENELHRGNRKMSDVNGGVEGAGDNGDSGGMENDDSFLGHNVDPTRPLASTGTTIRSGSGDHVNVFEDFGDEPGGEEAVPVVADTKGGEEEEDLLIKSGNEENNASSRLMKMIGVAGTGEAAAGGGGSGDLPAETAEAKPKEPKSEEKTMKPQVDSTASVPSNPWGAPASSVSSNPWGDAPAGGGFTAQDGQAAKDVEAAAQAQAAQRQREEELLLQQQQQQAKQQQQAEEEEKKRWAAMQAKQQAEMQAAAAAQQRQQEQLKAQQNQVELVLIERISNILENSWGRSDLNSILSTLHANDSRVIAILSTVEALRALVARHPQRIQLGRDPTMGAEMAALRLTNSQWQAHQAQVAQQQAAQHQAKLLQEQELQRRQRAAALQEEQARAVQQQEAMARAQAAQREAEQRKKQEVAQQQLMVFTDASWYYADPQGNIQGPFSGNEMRQWLDAGYFKGDLPISQNAGGPFRTLGSCFSDASTAFQPTRPSGEDKTEAEAKASADAEAKARAESEAKARAEAELSAQRERAEAEEAAALLVARQASEAKARAEAEERKRAEAQAQTQREKAVAATATEAARNEQSAQLKMMLGLGAAKASSGGDGVLIAGPPPTDQVVEQRAVQQAPAPAKKGKKKQQQQHQSESAVVHAPAPSVPEPAPAPPAAPAWGGAVATKATRKKSMSEIQQEEAREAARRAREQGISLSGHGGRGGSGGWANIAASGGSSAWGGAAARVPVAAVVTPAAAVAGLSAQQRSAQAAWSRQAAANVAPTGAKKQQSKSSAANASKNAAVDNFGMNGRMSPMLESWCKDQMQKLNGSDDLTLVSFCMTLTDRDEIRQYLTAYLGSTPQVNNFASEFIKRKGLGDNGRKEETWESAGGPKGKRGKKKGGK